MHLVPNSVTCCLSFILMVGLASAWLARVTERSNDQRWFQWFFIACFLLVSVSTLYALNHGPCGGVACGATLAVMVIAATCDLSSKRQSLV